MRRWWTAWADRLDTREDGLSLALVRIAVGAIVAGHLLHLQASGAIPLVWWDDDHGGLRDLHHPWIEALGGATPRTLGWLVPAVTASALAMALGFATRLTTVLTWLGFRTLGDLNGHAGGSYDELLINTLFLLVLARSGARLSLDRRFGGDPGPVPAWPRWLMVFQLVVVYTSTGFQKVSNHWVPWGDLDALWYILQQPTWHRTAMDGLWPLYPLTRVATLATWLFEVSAPLLLLAFWYRATRERPGWLRATLNRLDWRTTVLAVGVGMHVGIELTMEVGPFSFASLALYLACWSPDEWSALARRLRRATSAASPTAA